MPHCIGHSKTLASPDLKEEIGLGAAFGANSSVCSGWEGFLAATLWQATHPDRLSEDLTGSHKRAFALPGNLSHPQWSTTRTASEQVDLKLGFLDAKLIRLAGSLSDLDQVIYCVWASVFQNNINKGALLKGYSQYFPGLIHSKTT